MLLGLHASGVDWTAGACFTVLCHYRNPALWNVTYICKFMQYIYIFGDVFKKVIVHAAHEFPKPFFIFDKSRSMPD